MIKLMCLIPLKAGLSPEAFRDYYENHHVPLVKRLCPEMKAYRRNYVTREFLRKPEGAASLGFDVLTEVWIDDATYAEWSKVTADPPATNPIYEDELKFVDPTRVWMFRVDETPL